MSRGVIVARTLGEAYSLRASATLLDLSKSTDLVCVNIMCASLGGACACRLAQSLSRMEVLSELDVSGNKLTKLPDAVFELRDLRRLSAARNGLTGLPETLVKAAALRHLDLRDNLMIKLPLRVLTALPSLECIDARGNPLGNEAADEARLALGPRMLF